MVDKSGSDISYADDECSADAEISASDTCTAVDGERQAQSTLLAERLAFILPAINVALPADFFQWGDVAAGSSADKVFRVQNLSSVMVARDVVVSFSGSGSGSSNAANLHLGSGDERRFTATVEIGDLYPGESSDVVTMRRVVPSGAASGTKGFSVVGTVSSWEPSESVTAYTETVGSP